METRSETSCLRQAGNSIEALSLNESVKDIMNSECDEQKHRTEQTNLRSKNPETIQRVASGVKSKSLFEKTSFVITDQRGYNFNVN